MDLDRQNIEKRDFPIGRRGYEPEAVDAHLALIAIEIEDLRRESRAPRSGESLASAASSQVQAIVEAAESTAADIEHQATSEARRIRQDAERAAESTRDDAVARAQAHVDGVAKATQLMLQRVEAMEGEISALVESLRTGANRLSADLALLQGNMGELYDASGRRAGGQFEDDAPDLAELEDDYAQELEPEPLPPTEPAMPPPAAPPPAPTRAAAPAGGDLDGARLIALNMALNGQPREEADHYLAENFDLADRAALLDEVYAAVES